MSCILCRGKELKSVSTKDAKRGDFLNVSFCQSCGMVQQDPVPTEEELKTYYSTEYRKDYKNTYVPKIKHIFRAGSVALDRIKFLKNSAKEGRLLDVGAGGGEFTWLSREMGFDSKGIEPNVGYSNYAREEYGINIQTGELDDVTGNYQVITMFHVMEHMPDPVKTFNKLWNLLDDDGYLFIEVPNIESKEASPHNIYFKAHIHYFSEATLIASASQYFDVVVSDNSSNLRVLFRKRAKRLVHILPSKGQVNFTKNRLSKKGWLEYIFAGKGYAKLPMRLATIIHEAMLPKKSGLNLLKSLIKDNQQGTQF